jgi:hypothetical protein
MAPSRVAAASTLRRVLAPAAAFAGWCAFTWYLVAQATAGPVIIWSDSAAYRSVASKPLTSLAFWAGRRPPLTPLVIKLVGPATGYLVAQAVIGAVAWGVLAWTVGRLVARGWQRVVAVWVVLAFASALPITLWNRSLLSESLAMSALALVFAAVIWTARAWTWPRIAATAVACLAFAATRDAQVWTVAFGAVVVAVYALSRFRTSRGTAWRAGVLAVCLLLVTTVTEWGALSSHRTVPDVTDVFIVRIFPFPARVAWFASHGMPEQRQVDELARETPAPAGAAKVVAVPTTDPAYGPLRRWMVDEGPHTYLLWLVTHPGYVLTEPLVRPERAYNFAQGDLTFYAATQHRMASPLTIVMWPPLIGLLAMAALALYLGILSEAWRRRPWRAVLMLCGLGVAAMLVAWHGDGQEVTRHTVEGLAELRLGLWILIVVGLLGLDPAVDGEPEGAGAGDQRPSEPDVGAPVLSRAPTGPAPAADAGAGSPLRWWSLWSTSWESSSWWRSGWWRRWWSRTGWSPAADRSTPRC